MSFKRGDVLVGTKTANERYAVTVENSVVIFLYHYENQYPDCFQGLYVGNYLDNGIDKKINHYTDLVLSSNNNNIESASAYPIFYKIHDKETFVLLTQKIYNDKKIPKTGLPTL